MEQQHRPRRSVAGTVQSTAQSTVQGTDRGTDLRAGAAELPGLRVQVEQRTQPPRTVGGPRQRGRQASRAGRGVRTATGVLGELLITTGVLLLLFVVWQLWWTDVQADAAQREVTGQLQQEWGAGEETPVQLPDDAAPAGDAPPPEEPAPVAGDPFAVVYIPRFGEGWQPRPVYEGTGLDVLEKGVGHYPGTALPGAVGNLSLAGHRVTYGKPFNQIEELLVGDAVVVETAQAWYTYRVTSTRIVTPDQVEVIAPVPGDPTAVPTERMLTLTTCHPMYSARQRYIVHAVLDEWQPRSEGEPTALDELSAPGGGT